MTSKKCLSAAEALRRMVNELRSLVEEHSSSPSFQDVQHAFQLTPTLLLSSLLLALFCIAALIASPSPFGNTHVCGILLLLTLVFNTIWAVFEARKKKQETVMQLQCCISHMIDTMATSYLDDCLSLESFERLLNACDTAALLSSLSHTVSRVYKNENEVEVLRYIPTTLLVAGDQILLSPGQTAPAKVVLLEDESVRIERGGVFDTQTTESDSCTKADVNGERFKVLATPIIDDIKLYIADYRRTSNSIDATVFEKQREYILRLTLKYVIPTLLISATIVSVVKISIFHIPTDLSSFQHEISTCVLNKSIKSLVNFSSSPPWYTYIFQILPLLCLPFFPFYYHGLCTILITIGEAKTLAVYHISNEETTKYAAIPNTLTMSSQAITLENDGVPGLKWWSIFRDLICGYDRSHTHRRAGLFLPLGSLTVLCCLDKEGILSWLNPIAEKIFFFKQVGDANNTKRWNTPLATTSDDDSNIQRSSDIPVKDCNPAHEDQKVVPETLSLSQDSQDPSYVRFDDVNWRNNHSSLKPIGMNITLNLCSCSSEPQCKAFNDVITCAESFKSEFVSKIKNHWNRGSGGRCNYDTLQLAASRSAHLPTGIRMARKGLCDLATIIGMSQSVKQAYMVQKNVTAYEKSFDRSSKSSKQFAGVTGKRKLWEQCLPYLEGALFEDLIGDKQFLVYGTGDVIVDQCKEVWDGQNVHTMTPENRRKAMDFYQRSAVAGQCIAFAYSPVLSQSMMGKKNNIFNLSSVTDMKLLNDDLGEDVFKNLIFLGMITLQHQAKYTVCHMVDALERACIRFVHFSSDNEVKSQVFAEKMGLETGWNCYISLSPCKEETSHANATRPRHRSESRNSQQAAEVETQDMSKIQGEDDSEAQTTASSALIERVFARTQSESTTTDSLFNVSNRAKLPRGIQNIVPHIEDIDNVPLLVPLFTDSTPESAKEMIKIMKKYGEVVCCVGSADCIRNTVVFPAANVSIVIEPLLQPELKVESPVSSTSSTDSVPFLSLKEPNVDGLKALEVARHLNCFSCSALLPGDKGLPVIMNMIMQARHFLLLIRIFFLFLGKCEITLALVLLLSHVMILPIPFTPMDVFWLGFVGFPCLSLSLFGSPPDEDLMTWANEKSVPHRNPVLQSTIRDFLKKYTVKFLPSVLVLVFGYFLALQSSCMDLCKESIFVATENASYCRNSSVSLQCYPSFLLTISPVSPTEPYIHVSIWDATGLMKLKYRAVQMTVSVFLVVYMCVISLGYVHRWKKITDKLPFTNKFWWIMVISLISIQLIISVAVLFGPWNGISGSFIESKKILDFGSLQVVFWTILSVWILPCFLFNEWWKWREIKLWNRWQKRARLSFGTKLGMNSPF